MSENQSSRWPGSRALWQAVVSPRFVRWWIPMMLLLALDGYSLSAAEKLDSMSVGVYLAGLALSGLAMAWIVSLVEWLPRALAWVTAAALGAALSLLLVVNVIIFREFKGFLTPYMLRFVVDDPHYLHDYAVTYLFGAPGIALLAASSGLALLWNYGVPTAARRLTAKRLVVLVCMPLAVFAGSRGLRVAARSAHVDALTASTIAAIRYARQDWTAQKLANTARRPLAAAPAGDGPDILLVVNESWDRRAVPGFGGNPAASPLLAARLAASPGTTFAFHNALANATATDVSVPSLLSGVGPQEDAAKILSMPLVWDWAKAAGFATLFVSSQRLTWNGLDAFLKTPSLDAYRTAPEIGAPIINDLGIDDVLAAREYCRAAAAAPKDGRLFSVFNSNALHPPFQQTSDTLAKAPSFPDAFDNAVSVLDTALDTVIACAQARRREAIVLMTGDHGQGFVRGLPRLYSYYPDSVGIPMVMLVPDGVLQRHPDWRAALADNVNRNVMNLDVVPTMLDLMGLWGGGPNLEIGRQLLGRPLTREHADDRPMIALNTNDFKKIDHEGFGIYVGARYLIVSDLAPPALYDIERDRELKTNLWDRATPAEKAPFLALIEGTFQLRRIYHHASPSP